MTSSDIRKKYIEFFKVRGHKEIASAPLLPENDPTTLFTSSGMQPLVPYLLGQAHPLGKRLVNSQKCFRSQDIDEVGDSSHMTFFEMLGNWSLGDYFKKEQLQWLFEFLTKELELDPKRFYISVFEGSGSVPKDAESIEIWKDLFSKEGIHAEVVESHSAKASRDARIFLYDAHKNWWSRSGEPENMPPGEPGGPDSEVFYDFGGELLLHEHSQFKNEPCHPNCQCGRFMEIGNNVFMQYQKQADGSLKELPNKNVDFGGGLERLTAAVNNLQDIFLIDSFFPIIRAIENVTNIQYGKDVEQTKAMRVIADHMKAAVFMIADGVVPGNKAQGYFLRRLIRRSLLYSKQLGIWNKWDYFGQLVAPIATHYKIVYPNVSQKQKEIRDMILDEAKRFGKTVDKGLKELEKLGTVSGKDAFILYETYGFPWELTQEIVTKKGQKIDREEFEKEFLKHKELSRTASSGMFKGGLAEHNVETTKLHTATHLLHQALRMVLGNHVSQKGSNITVERLRFDFSHPTKMTPEELKKVEDIVNEQIKKNLAVTVEELDKDEALKSGALGFFVEKYGDRVKVYSILNFSREICGGPHVRFTGELGHFTIIKEESAASGIRRIYARVNGHEIV
jgi:alanyl-tRNA synthetase